MPTYTYPYHGIPRWPLPSRLGQGIEKMDGPELMTMANFIVCYACPRTTAYREIAEGRLKIRKLRTATRIARIDADAWLAVLPTRQVGSSTEIKLQGEGGFKNAQKLDVPNVTPDDAIEASENFSPIQSSPRRKRTERRVDGRQ